MTNPKHMGFVYAEFSDFYKSVLNVNEELQDKQKQKEKTYVGLGLPINI